MKITIHFFGMIAETIGQEKLEINDFEGKDLGEVKAFLEARFPMLQMMPYTMALNKKIASENAVLVEENEVALLPPFAGG